ncbi:MAG: hypothetical protein H6937_02195 [Burkholderiales bacterium]|nr:hypothetical protein [Burkholderiales bacterium]
MDTNNIKNKLCNVWRPAEEKQVRIVTRTTIFGGKYFFVSQDGSLWEYAEPLDMQAVEEFI